MLLKDKIALVTGGSRGIGRGIALKLAESGCKVVINYRQNDTAAADTLERVRQLGSDGFLVQADVSRPEDLRVMLERVRTQFGHVAQDRNASSCAGKVAQRLQRGLH